MAGYRNSSEFSLGINFIITKFPDVQMVFVLYSRTIVCIHTT